MFKCFSYLFIILLLNNNNILCEDLLEYNNPELSSDNLNKLEGANSEIVYDDQPTSGEHFVAIRVDAAVGATEQLSPTLKGLETMAITYLPHNYIYVNVISATREVVAGVRYNLIVAAIAPNTDNILCELTVLEKPWIVNEWGTKQRSLTYTNCTDSNINNIPEVIHINNDRINPIFQNNNNEMTDERLKNLEDLIMPVQRKYKTRRPINQNIESENINIVSNTNFQNPTRFGTESQSEVILNPTEIPPIIISNQSQQFLDNFFSFANDQSHVDDPTPNQNVDVTIYLPNDGNNQKEIDYIVNKLVNDENKFVQFINQEQIKQNEYATNSNLPDLDATTEFFAYESSSISLENHVEDIQSRINEELNFGTTEEVIIQPNISDNLKNQENSAATESNRIVEETDGVGTLSNPSEPEVTVIYPNFDYNEATTEENINYYDESSTIPIVTENFETHNVDSQIKVVNCLPSTQEIETVSISTENSPVIDRQKRSTPHENAYFLEVSNQALQQLDHYDRDDYKRVVIKVLDAKEIQKNSNEKYILLQLEIANSHCMEEATNLDECKQNIVKGSTKFCELEVRESDAPLQVSKSECSPARVQRQAGRAPGSPGPLDLQQHPEIVGYLNQAIVNVNGQEQENYTLLEIIESTVQVVAGSLYKIKAKFTHANAEVICTYEIWNRPWIAVNGREVSVACENEKKYKFSQSSQSRKRRHVVGAPEPVEDFGTVQELVDEAFVNINGQEGSEEGYTLQRIISSTKQVVAGMKYFIRAEFTHKNSDIICNLTIWDRQWIKIDGRDVKVACENERNYDFLQTSGAKLQDDILRVRRQVGRLVGAPADVSHDNPTVVEYLNYALETVNGQEGDEGYVLLRIVRATQQVVAGVQYEILAEFSHKDSTVNCTFTIWDQAWIKVNGRQVSAVCDNAKNYNFLQSARVKRQIGGANTLVGAPTIIDANENSNIGKFLNEVLLTVNEKSGKNKYTLVRIVEATHQVITGSLYKVKAELNYKNSPVQCDFKIWDQPWIKADKRKFEAKCSNKKKFSFPDESAEDSSSESQESSESGSSEENKPMRIAGGISSIAIDDPNVISYLTDAVVGVNGAETEEGAGYTLVRVVEATVQVVEGRKYVIKAEFAHKNSNVNCTFTIWDRPWVKPDGRQTDVNCDNEKKYNLRQRRQVALLGAPNSVPIDDPSVVSQLNDALVGVNGAETEEGAGYTLVRIIESTKQVVAGHKYVIKAEFVHKNSNVNCTFSIWDRPWIKPDGRQTDVSCDNEKKYNFRQRRQIGVPGAPYPVPINDPTVVSYLNDALVGLNGAETEEGAGYTLVKIIESSKQVVSGIKYVIKAEFVHKNSNVKCTFSIWDRPWIPVDGRQTDVSCDNEKKYNLRQKRQTVNTPNLISESAKQKRSLDYDYLELDRELYSDDLDINVLFEKYKIYYSKNYPTTREHTMRLRIFKDSLIKIKQLNKHEKGTGTYGVTEFSDLTTQEYRQRTGLLTHLRHENNVKNPLAVIPQDLKIPRAFDWRERNVITEVKNQGNCGSCWAFSVTGNIEGLNAIKTGQLQEFSEQELVDCDTVDQGCNGGLPDNAYKAIEQLGGLESETEYPYNARKGSCHFNRTLTKVTVKGAVDLPKNETAMAQFLLSNGPISIGINAAAMQFYRGGVSHPWHPLCRSAGIDHGVLIVGFGISEYPLFKKKLPFWIVKNSWGPMWGEQGYYRVFRGDNTCGISDMASSAVLE